MAGYAAATDEDLHPYTNGLTPYAPAAAPGGGAAKRPRVAAPDIARRDERSEVRTLWPQAPLRYGEWVLDRQWSDPQVAKTSLGFGRVAINQSDAY